MATGAAEAEAVRAMENSMLVSEPSSFTSGRVATTDRADTAKIRTSTFRSLEEAVQLERSAGIRRSVRMVEEAGADKILTETEPVDIPVEEPPVSDSLDHRRDREAFRLLSPRMAHPVEEVEEEPEVPERTRMHRRASGRVTRMQAMVEREARPSTAHMVEAEEAVRTRPVQDLRLLDPAVEVPGREDSITKTDTMDWSSSSGRSVKSLRRRRSDD